MKLTAKIKLLPSDLEHQALVETMRFVNECCDYISNLAFESKTFSRFAIQKKFYKSLRNQFPELNAQMIIRCIGKVASSYVKNKSKIIKFKPTGSINYDQRILTLRNEKQFVSISSVLGRLKINYIAGAYQHSLLQYYENSECKLVFKKNSFYLYCAVNIVEESTKNFKNYLGVDLGIRNIAVTSDGKRYSGAHINNMRKRHKSLRSRLQSKATRSAKRLLRKRSGKERKFCTNQNHIISKKIVAKAKHTNSNIVLENLKGIRQTRVNKAQRSNLNSWSFYQLKQFIKYKAQLAGIEVLEVNPAKTSQTCPKCGYVSKRNRKSQSEFCCKQCDYADHADYVAAVNIMNRGVAVNQPYVSNS